MHCVRACAYIYVRVLHVVHVHAHAKGRILHPLEPQVSDSWLMSTLFFTSEIQLIFLCI